MNSSAFARLVVNADDYGMTKSISKGILKAHTDGIVTSVSIVTNTPAFQETLSWIKDMDIDKGIHLTLNSGEPLSSSINNLPIVRNNGTFYQSPAKTPLFYFVCKPKWKEWIHDEFRRQIEQLLSMGIKINHLDSHFHIHVLPGIANIIPEIVREYNIPYVRKPYEAVIKKKILHPFHNIISYLSQKSFSFIDAKFLPFYGLTEAGRINTNMLVTILNSIITERGELMLHPGYNSMENLRYYPANVNNFESELGATIHPHVRATLRERKIEFIRRNQLS